MEERIDNINKLVSDAIDIQVMRDPLDTPKQAIAKLENLFRIAKRINIDKPDDNKLKDEKNMSVYQLCSYLEHLNTLSNAKGDAIETAFDTINKEFGSDTSTALAIIKENAKEATYDEIIKAAAIINAQNNNNELKINDLLDLIENNGLNKDKMSSKEEQVCDLIFAHRLCSSTKKTHKTLRDLVTDVVEKSVAKIKSGEGKKSSVLAKIYTGASQVMGVIGLDGQKDATFRGMLTSAENIALKSGFKKPTTLELINIANPIQLDADELILKVILTTPLGDLTDSKEDIEKIYDLFSQIKYTELDKTSKKPAILLGKMLKALNEYNKDNIGPLKDICAHNADKSVMDFYTDAIIASISKQQDSGTRGIGKASKFAKSLMSGIKRTSNKDDIVGTKSSVLKTLVSPNADGLVDLVDRILKSDDATSKVMDDARKYAGVEQSSKLKL